MRWNKLECGADVSDISMQISRCLRRALEGQDLARSEKRQTVPHKYHQQETREFRGPGWSFCGFDLAT